MKPKAGPVQQGTSKSTKKLALISIGLKKTQYEKNKKKRRKKAPGMKKIDLFNDKLKQKKEVEGEPQHY